MVELKIQTDPHWRDLILFNISTMHWTWCQSSNWLDRFSGKTDSAVGNGSQDEADCKGNI